MCHDYVYESMQVQGCLYAPSQKNNASVQWSLAQAIYFKATTTTGFIRDAETGHTSLCLEVNASGGNVVRLATCDSSKPSQEWESIPDALKGDFTYMNQYDGLCLHAPAQGDTMNVAVCDGESVPQQFNNGLDGVLS